MLGLECGAPQLRSTIVTPPLPDAGTVDLTPPSATESVATARAIAALVSVDGSLGDTQRLLLEALFPA
jgi:hypothetical protein